MTIYLHSLCAPYVMRSMCVHGAYPKRHHDSSWHSSPLQPKTSVVCAHKRQSYLPSFGRTLSSCCRCRASESDGDPARIDLPSGVAQSRLQVSALQDFYRRQHHHEHHQSVRSHSGPSHFGSNHFGSSIPASWGEWSSFLRCCLSGLWAHRARARTHTHTASACCHWRPRQDVAERRGGPRALLAEADGAAPRDALCKARAAGTPRRRGASRSCAQK